MIEQLSISTTGPGLFEITAAINDCVQASEIESGLCTVFVRHTSASLLIQENADPSAARDLENWLNRLVPEGDPLYRHTSEGTDDMPAHIKSALTCTSLGIPFCDHRLLLGTWQGIYLWEHRRGRNQRQVAIHIGP